MRKIERPDTRQVRRVSGRLGVVVAMLAAVFVVSPTAPAWAGGSCNQGEWISVGSDVYEFRPVFRNSEGGSLLCTLWEPEYNNWGVVALQNALNKCYNQGIARDGDFGSGTTRALKNAQTWENATRNAGLTVDGKYGPDTYRMMKFPRYKEGAGIDGSFACRSLY
jgi:hypothetical protein